MGGAQGDQGRNATGEIVAPRGAFMSASGIFAVVGGTDVDWGGGGGSQRYLRVNYSLSRAVPTGAAFAPRRWGALACCYLGTPTL